MCPMASQFRSSIKVIFYVLTLLLLFDTIAIAQEFNSFRGTNQRQGRRSPDTASNDIGRAGPVWVDPDLVNGFALFTEVLPGAGTSTATTSGVSFSGSWDAVDDTFATADIANNYVNPVSGTTPSYYFVVTVEPGASTNDFEWTFVSGQPATTQNSTTTVATTNTNINVTSTGQTTTTQQAVTTTELPTTQSIYSTANIDVYPINGGDIFEIYVNIPLGSTNGLPAQRFFTYVVSGIQANEGDSETIILDTQGVNTGYVGGYLRLGGQFQAAGTTGEPITTPITVTLKNTFFDSPLNPPDTEPGNTLVYAGGCILKKPTGYYVASPVVAQLSSETPLDPWRVVAAKNEFTTTPDLLNDDGTSASYGIGIVSSYLHDGTNVDGTPELQTGAQVISSSANTTAAQAQTTSTSIRRNLVWSWPVARPFTSSTDDQDTYNTNKINFINANIDATLDDVLVTDQLKINATPIITTVSVGGTSTDVVIVTREDGTIFCLDAAGDVTSGTTSEVLFGSVRVNADGVSFGTSSPLVQTLTNGNTIIFIGASDGSVYAVNIADGISPAGPPGFPVAVSAGAIEGSIAFATAGGSELIIVPTIDKGVVALNAVNGAQVWQFPLSTAPAIGEVTMTPAVEFGNIYFGDSNGNFYALDIATGLPAVGWANPFQASNINGIVGSFEMASPATVPSDQMLGLQQDTVFATDSNNIVYAIPANSSAVAIWTSNGMSDLGAAASGSITFTTMSIENSSGSYTSGVPALIIPTLASDIVAIDATNSFPGVHSAPGNVSTNYSPSLPNPVLTLSQRFGPSSKNSAAVGGGVTFSSTSQASFTWMYVTDLFGFLYAFTDRPPVSIGLNFPDDVGTTTPGAGGVTPEATPPTETEEQKRKRAERELEKALDAFFQDAEIGFLAPWDYDKLSKEGGGGKYSIQDLSNNAEEVTRRTFEFGEKIYVAVYVPVPPTIKMPELELTTGPTPPIKKKPTPLKDGQVYLFDFQADCMYVAKSGKNQAGFSVGSNNLITLKSGTATIRIPESKRRYTLAHPLGISLAPESGKEPNTNPLASLGVFIDLSDDKLLPQVERNGSGSGFVDKKTKKPLTFRQYFSQDGSNTAVLDPEKDNEKIPQVAHGKTANAVVYVYDRSLMQNLGKPIDVSVLTHNLKWVMPKDPKANGEPDFGITNELSKDIYKGYEDNPETVGGSADYPGIPRTAIKVYNRSFDSSFNASRVVRSGPGYPSGAIALPTRLVFPKSLSEIKKDTPDNYKEYNKYAVKRDLVPTKFDFQLNVPRFQPPSEKGYEGANFQFFINRDPYQTPGRKRPPQPINRPFTLRTYIAEDANIEIETPIIDFGSMSAGAGFGKALTLFPSFSKSFKIRNIGNVNLLNIHVLKNTEEGPTLIRGEGMDPNAAISISNHGLSNIDEPYLTNIYNEHRTFNFGNTLILQKPRVGDKKGRLLEIPPKRRANAGLTLELGAPVLDNTGPDGQPMISVLPQVTVRLPIGTPIGIYKTPFMIADDSLKTPKGPELHFRVTETKLTNTAEQLEDTNQFFIQPMIDLIKGDKRYAWANVQPTAIRDQAGNLVIAWASNRLDSQGVPSFLPSNKYVGAKNRRDLWRVYMSTLAGATPKTAEGEGPLSDLDGFKENPNGLQWFRQVPILSLDAAQESQLFGGDSEIIEGTQSYNGPIFSTALPNRTPPVSGRYFAFLIDAEKRIGQSQVVSESRICLAKLNMTDIETVQSSILPSMHVDLDVPAGIPINDPFSAKSRPSLIQIDNNATLFYAASTTGGGQLRWNTFNGTRWSTTGILPLENSMESIDAPTTVIRSAPVPTTTTPYLIDLVFSARLRGRAQSELFYLRLAANEQGVPVMPTDTAPDPLLSFSQTQDLIKFEPKTGTFWASGAIWRILAEDIDENLTNRRVDLLTTDNTGQTKSILDYSTKNYNPGTNTLSFNTTLGGKVYLDTIKGSIQFSDALIPQDLPLMIQYTPRIYRLTTGTETDQDHRLPTLTYDQTQSRFILTYTKVSESDAQGAPITSRPCLRTKKWGIELPVPINAPKGHSTMLRVLTSMDVPIEMSQYTVDLSNNRIYFKPTFENQVVNIEYQAVGQKGSTTPIKLTNKAVRLIEEKNEFVIPISHPVNEIGLVHILDPIEFQSENLRPRLIWMFWSSTRAGAPDLYFQTMAPQLDFKKSQ